MGKIEELCFYYEKGNCNFLLSSISKCNFCPNFISFKKEAREISDNDSLPVTYFDVVIKEKGNGIQKSLPITLE